MLREALKKEMSIADNFKRLYEAELAKNQKLEAQVAKLESRPISIKAEKYFEHYDVAHQVVTLQPRPTAKRLKSKTKYVDTANQLDLWKDNPAISL